MKTLKEEAINALLTLPDNAEIDEMMYRLYVIDQVEKGRAEIKDGKFITVDDLEKEIEAW
jgi:predicted transcriptional regulator